MSNPAFLFQMGMVAKMIEARHKDGCNWSVEFVLRDAAGRIIMQCGDEPQWWWRSTIPTDPRKEVMQTGAVHTDSARSESATDTAPVTPPAVSESAAGDHRPATDRPSVLGSAVMAAIADWPGPDWSQAPEWAVAWAMDADGDAYWHVHVPGASKDEWPGLWNAHQVTEFTASTFNYPGNWRDSLRKRPA